MYSFIDVEASGLGVGSYPIEAGIALPDGKTKCMLICPPPQWTHWDIHAEELHGISRESLLVNGRSVLQAAMLLNEWLAGQTVYTDAWGNDSCWLAKLFAEAGVVQRFMLDSVVTLLDQTQQDAWHPTKDRIIEESGILRHRASNDALVVQKTVTSLMESNCSEQTLRSICSG
mgnify:FL=1